MKLEQLEMPLRRIKLDGYPVILADTAGIREAKNDIEKKEYISVK